MVKGEGFFDVGNFYYTLQAEPKFFCPLEWGGETEALPE